MSIDKIHLRRLLLAFGLEPKRRLALVRADARAELRKAYAPNSGGNDFHSCFWADVKSHAAYGDDLMALTNKRVEDAKGRARLYPMLAKGYLTWWNNKRRWVNEEIRITPKGVSAPYNFVEMGGTIKVENLLALTVGGGRERLIYPYFSELPSLTPDTARLGLWLMSQALPSHNVDDMRILDVIRGEPYSVDRYPLSGNEGALFVERYARILSDWRGFIKEFG